MHNYNKQFLFTSNEESWEVVRHRNSRTEGLTVSKSFATLKSPTDEALLNSSHLTLSSVYLLSSYHGLAIADSRVQRVQRAR